MALINVCFKINKLQKKGTGIVIIIIIIDRFYRALFSTLEQIHCGRMWFYMSE